MFGEGGDRSPSQWLAIGGGGGSIDSEQRLLGEELSPRAERLLAPPKTACEKVREEIGRNKWHPTENSEVGFIRC